MYEHYYISKDLCSLFVNQSFLLFTFKYQIVKVSQYHTMYLFGIIRWIHSLFYLIMQPCYLLTAFRNHINMWNMHSPHSMKCWKYPLVNRFPIEYCLKITWSMNSVLPIRNQNLQHNHPFIVFYLHTINILTHFHFE